MNEIRLLRKSDVPAALRLCRAAGWNQTAADWERVMALEPEGCFAIEDAGEVIATATAVCYGTTLAWIGMVLTLPEYRGKGLARRLMEHALDFLRARRVGWIRLDATDMGHQLYVSLGFADEQPIERWRAEPRDSVPGPELPGWRPEPALDLRAFSADRTVLLNELAGGESACLPGEGFAMGRPGANALFFGPCVARSPQVARNLLQWFLGRHPGEPIFWDLLPENQEAVNLARELGFKPVRRLMRMAMRGVSLDPAPAEDVGLVYAAAGFEYG